jgi:hypothetical protein
MRLMILFFCGTTTRVACGCATSTSDVGISLAGAAVPTTNVAQTVTVGAGGAPAKSTSGINCPKSAVALEAGVPCGDLHCLAFTNERSAFAHVLARHPLVLGVGESHAQKGSELVRSATRRFADLFLPDLCGQSKSIVLEIWLPRNDCGDKRVEQVDREQSPVTATQAKSNKNEYVILGQIAKQMGIEPSALVPTCDEYQSILDAGPDSIERMLALIGKRTGDRVAEELRRFSPQVSGPVVIAYGGALHNDVDPTPDHKDYSFGPSLMSETKGKYIELDLVVREYVKNTRAWQRQPWYRAFKKNRDTLKTILYQSGPNSFALVFPASTTP